MARRTAYACVAIAPLLLIGRSAAAGSADCYSIDVTRDVLVVVDPLSGTVTDVGPIGYDAVNPDLAVVHGRLFVFEQSAVREIDPFTGSAGAARTLIYQGTPTNGDGLAPSGAGFSLTAAVQSPAGSVSGVLATFDLTTGATVNAGSVGSRDADAMDRGPDGLLYAVDAIGGPDIVFRINNPASGTTEVLFTGTAGAADVFDGIAFVGHDLFVLGRLPSNAMNIVHLRLETNGTLSTVGDQTLSIGSVLAGLAPHDKIGIVQRPGGYGFGEVNAESYAAFRYALLGSELFRVQQRLDPKPRVLASILAASLVAQRNPLATPAQLDGFIRAYDAHLASLYPATPMTPAQGDATPDDPFLTVPGLFLAAARFGVEIDSGAGLLRDDSALAGLDLTVGEDLIKFLGIHPDGRITPSLPGTMLPPVYDVRWFEVEQINGLDLIDRRGVGPALINAMRGVTIDGTGAPGLAEAVLDFLVEVDLGDGKIGYESFARPIAQREVGVVLEEWCALPGDFGAYTALRSPAEGTPFAAFESSLRGIAGASQTRREEILTRVNPGAGFPPLLEAHENAQVVDPDASLTIQRFREQVALINANRARAAFASALLEQSPADTYPDGPFIAAAARDFASIQLETEESFGWLEVGLEFAGAFVGIGAGIKGKDPWGAAQSVFSLVMTGLGVVEEQAGPPSVEEQLWDQVIQMRQQIEDMRIEMNARFDRIDAKLDTIYAALEGGFDDIDAQLTILNNRVELLADLSYEIQLELTETQDLLRSSEARLTDFLAQLATQGLYEDLIFFFGGQLGQNPLPFGDFIGANGLLVGFNSAASLPTIYAADASDRGAQPYSVAETLSAVPGNLTNDPDRRDRVVNDLDRLAGVVGGAQLDPGSTPLPAAETWSRAADAYADLARVYPWYFLASGNQTTNINAAFQPGDRLVRALAGPRVGAMNLLDTLGGRYGTAADDFENALVRGFTSAFIRHSALPTASGNAPTFFAYSAFDVMRRLDGVRADLSAQIADRTVAVENDEAILPPMSLMRLPAFVFRHHSDVSPQSIEQYFALEFRVGEPDTRLEAGAHGVNTPGSPARIELYLDETMLEASNSGGPTRELLLSNLRAERRPVGQQNWVAGTPTDACWWLIRDSLGGLGGWEGALLPIMQNTANGPTEGGPNGGGIYTVPTSVMNHVTHREVAPGNVVEIRLSALPTIEVLDYGGSLATWINIINGGIPGPAASAQAEVLGVVNGSPPPPDLVAIRDTIRGSVSTPNTGGIDDLSTLLDRYVSMAIPSACTSNSILRAAFRGSPRSDVSLAPESILELVRPPNPMMPGDSGGALHDPANYDGMAENLRARLDAAQSQWQEFADAPDAHGDVEWALASLEGLFFSFNRLATDDMFAVEAGETLAVAAAEGLLRNDALQSIEVTVTVHSFTQPSTGTVSVMADGAFTFTPPEGAQPGDEFTFTYRLTGVFEGVGSPPVSAPAKVVVRISSVVVPPFCSGDANSDGQVNFADITNVLTFWLFAYPGSTGPGDANGDGTVNFADVTSVLTFFAVPCP